MASLKATAPYIGVYSETGATLLGFSEAAAATAGAWLSGVAETIGSATTVYAPNNGTNNPTQNPRATQCKIKVGVGIGLDVAGTALSFASGAGEGIVIAQVTVGLASAAYSAYNGSVSYTLENATGAQVSAITAGAAEVGWKATATTLTRFGRGLSAFALGADLINASSLYQACLAGH
ncbi:hypothetical protein [Edaphobacter albus]|uniref:hypothetical protein n=1 Tax=Edaphobacter sp. 4G125 TaxID=2763071 RepID=UPI00164477B2|nr:hypothetical protein [Edaphobacter sp. 4G125]QNI35459.1 hypothetical protein H7846_10240 [Edaphobacter sp. 4G125]